MLVKVLVKTDLEIQLFLSETAMTDCKIFVDELDGEERLLGVKWCCFLYACIGTLADGFRDYPEGQLAREWGELRVRYHGG